jgi:thiamine-phosphate pyrophosphorylase
MSDPLVLRLIDANLNRAREGLRVMEDYARFVLNDASLGEALKRNRQRLASATQDVAEVAIVHRDTQADIGKTFDASDAPPRESLRDVVTAAGKRVGEALRAIEETLKTIDPRAASLVESSRYTHYELEQAIALTFNPFADRLKAMRLYVIVTEAACGGRSWVDVTRAALAGGADILQLREKSLEGGELLKRARVFVAMCREAGALSIINDRADIARLSDADGVHVGQGDLHVADARAIVGPRKLVGVSTHTIDDARRAAEDGADYIGVGPLFKSSTKPRDFVSGLEFAKQVANEIALPAVGIAGITLENVAQVRATGLKAVAVTSAIVGAPDVEAATRAFRAALQVDRDPSPSGSG